jgi:hypothetical protein
MRKALLMGVSGAALLFGASAYAGDNTIVAFQGLGQANLQGQGQGQGVEADGGNGGRGGSGGDAVVLSKRGDPAAIGGNGGRGGAGAGALATGSQQQTQAQANLASQSQSIALNANTTAGDKGVAVSGDHDKVTSQSAVADGEKAMAANNGGMNIAAWGEGSIAAGGSVVNMKNDTHIEAKNEPGDIKIIGGDANGGNGYGGKAYGGDANGGFASNFQSAKNTNLGEAGNASAKTDKTIAGDGGKGGSGGDALAVQANVSGQKASQNQTANGGRASAESLALGKSSASSRTGALSAAVGVNLGLNGSRTGGFIDPRASSSARQGQTTDPTSVAGAFGPATSLNLSPATSTATGGKGGTNTATATNTATQTGASWAAGGNGGNGGSGGNASSVAKAMGGDNMQSASSLQLAAAYANGGVGGAATGGAGTGGAGGNASANFVTGGASITQSSMNGISNASYNSGVAANALNTFSINANASFH